MTREQLDHYLIGGKFRATYNPKKLDISYESLHQIGSKIEVFQNIIIAPLGSPYEGQHAFNCHSIYGWFPEEDITDLEIIDEYIERPESLPQFLYRLTYTDRDKIFPNFGKGNFKIPLVVSRSYSVPNDAYVLVISNPPADKLEKAIWKGEFYEDIEWKPLIHEDVHT